MPLFRFLAYRIFVPPLFLVFIIFLTIFEANSQGNDSGPSILESHKPNKKYNSETKITSRLGDENNRRAAGAFTPPPKSITDITLLLSREISPSRLSQVAALTKVFNSPVPSASDSEALFEYYIKHARAAGGLGKSEIQKADFYRAIELYENGKVTVFNAKVLYDLYSAAGLAAARSGSSLDQIRFLEKAHNFRADKNEICMASIAALYHAQLGALDKSDKWLKTSYNNISYIDPLYWKPRDIYSVKACFYSSKAGVLIEKGKYSLALKAANKGVSFARKAMQGVVLGDFKSVSQSNLADLGIRSLILAFDYQSNAFLSLDRVLEAEIAQREAFTLRINHWGPVSERVAYSLGSLAHIFIAQERFQDAHTMINESIRIWEKLDAPKSSRRYTNSLLTKAELLSLEERWDDALSIFHNIARDYTVDPYLVSQNLTYLSSLIKSEKAQKAKDFLELAYKSAQSNLGPKHQKTAEYGALLAVASSHLQKTDYASDLFGKNVPILLRRSRQSTENASQSFSKAFRTVLILEEYIAHLVSLNDNTSTDLAFQIADIARGSSVQQAFSKAAARKASNNSSLARSIRQEQDLQIQIAALYGRITHHSSLKRSLQSPKVLLNLRVLIDKLRTERAELMAAIEKGLPEYAEILSPKPLDFKSVQSLLTPEEALISYFLGSSRLFVWTITQDSEPKALSIKITAQELSKSITTLRTSLTPDIETIEDIPPFNTEEAQSLFDILLGGTKAIWGPKKDLLVVKHKTLGHLPFALLPTGPTTENHKTANHFEEYRNVPWLVRSHSVVTLPTVLSLKTLRGNDFIGGSHKFDFIGFADPVFAEETVYAQEPETNPPTKQTKVVKAETGDNAYEPIFLRSVPNTTDNSTAVLSDLPQLPDTREEIDLIAKLLGADFSKDVYFGPEATERNVLSAKLEDYRIVAFATHGLLPGELDGLREPALALSRPKSEVSSSDGILGLSEILSLRLTADWVILSACNSGAGTNSDAEAVSGLGRAFLYAGAKALLVTNWPVETTSARLLTTGLFSRQLPNSGVKRATALKEAMLEVIDTKNYVDDDTGEILFTYAHPIFWAPFSLVGDNR